MNITQLLKNYEKICLGFESEDEVELKKRNKTLSFITGFVSGMFFSQSEWKLRKSGIFKTYYKKLSPEEIKSGWYKVRKFSID